MSSLRHAVKQFLPKRSYYTYVNEPAMPIKGKEPKWCKKPEDVFEKLDSGQVVFASGAAATPIILLNAMTEVAKAKKLKNIKVCDPAFFNNNNTPFAKKKIKRKAYLPLFYGNMRLKILPNS